MGDTISANRPHDTCARLLPPLGQDPPSVISGTGCDYPALPNGQGFLVWDARDIDALVRNGWRLIERL